MQACMNSLPPVTPMVPRTVGDLVFLLSERACARGLTEAEAAQAAGLELDRLLRRTRRATRRKLLRHR